MLTWISGIDIPVRRQVWDERSPVVYRCVRRISRIDLQLLEIDDDDVDDGMSRAIRKLETFSSSLIVKFNIQHILA